jgi:predicted lipoprotein with Yx(FWY)xxD motif
MRRGLVLIPVALLAAPPAVAAGAATGAIAVKVGQSSALGSILVSSTGRTLYHDTREQKGSIKCVGACSKTWLPLTVGGGAKPRGGPGITAAKLGTVKRPDGKLQVTYNGLALYRYSADAKAGDAHGQGEGKSWYAVTPAGKITKATASSAPAKPKSCPIALGTVGAGSAAGASATLTLDCAFLADGVAIQIPGHAVATIAATPPGGSCTPAGDTITCKLDPAGEQQGISYAGSWQVTFRWRFASTDPASTAAQCGPLQAVVTLTSAGATVYSKPLQIICTAP